MARNPFISPAFAKPLSLATMAEPSEAVRRLRDLVRSREGRIKRGRTGNPALGRGLKQGR